MVVKLCPVVVVSKSGIVKKMQTFQNFYHLECKIVLSDGPRKIYPRITIFLEANANRLHVFVPLFYAEVIKKMFQCTLDTEQVNQNSVNFFQGFYYEMTGLTGERSLTIVFLCNQAVIKTVVLNKYLEFLLFQQRFLQ